MRLLLPRMIMLEVFLGIVVFISKRLKRQNHFVREFLFHKFGHYVLHNFDGRVDNKLWQFLQEFWFFGCNLVADIAFGSHHAIFQERTRLVVRQRMQVVLVVVQMRPMFFDGRINR